ncbi:MAG: LUD domain-containing protein [Fidelibacterota bacterium]|nr:MAG: LUD domain-containing protein [Candidatus Neomarinimicrobiota bacterium]
MARLRTIPTDQIHPRDVADKSVKGSLERAIRMALEVESGAVRRNTQTFNLGRYQATADIADYEELKDRARAIKEAAIESLSELLATLEASVTSRGGHYYLARDAADACYYIKRICLERRARLVVKAKSMTTEEIGLNGVLEQASIEVVETDLAEFILQVSGEQPSHIVAPAIHRSRERISQLFKAAFETDHPLDSGEDLTRFARDQLREKFLTADIGISGANVIAADTGTLVLVESEGNIRMVTQAPPVHIAVAGVEKVVSRREDLAPFIELLGPSGTGQPLTSYTSVITPPLDFPSFSFGGSPARDRQFHLVLIDNGRMTMREDPVLREALYCIRCSACLNVCANFQTVGGHAFGGETYSGGIGGSWEAGTGTLQKARFTELCTGCSRCVPQCPVRIDIPWLNTVLKSRLDRAGGGVSLQKRFFGNFYHFARWGSRVTPFAGSVLRLSPSRWLLEKMAGVDRRPDLPESAVRPLTRQYRQWRKIQAPSVSHAEQETPHRKALLFADVYTNYTLPQRGMATIKVLECLGVQVELSRVMAEGRATLSQGMIVKAGRRAENTAAYLESRIDQGRDIVVVEPSVLALFRHDYRHLLGNPALFEKLKANSYDPIEYLLKIIGEDELELKQIFNVEETAGGRIFFHGHCQQKTIDATAPTVTLLRQLGFEIDTSSAECCGMAGSFGYKREYHELSMSVGEDLFNQVRQTEIPGGDRTILASGISCCEQIRAGISRRVLHPMELLAEVML